MLIALAGLPATGKSTIAAELAKRVSARVLDKDRVRASLFQVDDIDFTGAQNDLCVGIMFEVASYHLKKDPDWIVVIDGRTFSKRYQVQAVKEFAAQVGTSLALIECVIDELIAYERIRASMAEGKHLAGNRNIDLYNELKAHADPVEEPKLVINTGSTPLEECVERILQYIQGIQNIESAPNETERT